MREHVRAGFARDFGRPIARAVVDDDDVRNLLLRAGDYAAEGPLGVVGGDDDEHPLAHAASRDTTAQTMPPPAEMELTTMCRSGRSSCARVGANGSSGSRSSKPA